MVSLSDLVALPHMWKLFVIVAAPIAAIAEAASAIAELSAATPLLAEAASAYSIVLTATAPQFFDLEGSKTSPLDRLETPEPCYGGKYTG